MDQPHPGLSASLFKGHGHGNDYLVFREGSDWVAAPEHIRRVCDRHVGVGSDGIVVVLDSESEDVIRLRMFNPDGSEFERSGNGLRVVAACLHRAKRVGFEPFQVHVGGDVVSLQVLEEGPGGELDVTVDMGTVVFGPRAVGMNEGLLTPEGHLVHSERGPVPLHLVSVGNPHAVVFSETLDDELFMDLGPWLCRHRAFERGINVQLAQVVSPGDLRIRIWERGVGPTSSSGTSACAAAAAGVESGRLAAGTVTVHMDGGEFTVEVGVDHRVLLRGPVSPVFTARLEPGLLRALR